MSSIYSFFASLLPLRGTFRTLNKLEDFPFDESLLACRNQGSFPDLILRTDPHSEDYIGGELIELKDSRSYSVASFNSTIPSGRKNLLDLITSPHSRIYQQLIQNGEDPYQHPNREVFYLIRGRKQEHVKVCLVHGSFFETVDIHTLIQNAFAQVIQDGVSDQQPEIDSASREQLVRLLSQQSYFRKTRDVPNASVKLRFRVMTEVKKEGNILNSKQYPQISDDSLNLVVPCRQESEMAFHIRKINQCVAEELYRQLASFTFHHPLNGPFLVFQIQIQS